MSSLRRYRFFTRESISPRDSVGHICSAAGVVRAADGGTGSKTQTGGERQAAGGAGGGAQTSEGGANSTGHAGTRNAGGHCVKASLDFLIDFQSDTLAQME